MSIGLRIKKLREQLCIPQAELARMVGITKQSLYKYENSIITNIPSNKIEAIAKKLHTTPAYLMGWTENEETEKKNDAIADIILNLRSDSEFLKITTIINKMPKEQYGAINAFLTVLQEQDIN